MTFLARDTLFPVPFVGWVLRNTYVMPIRRDAATTETLRESIRRVEHGFYVGIFPEGTRSQDGSIGEDSSILSSGRSVGLWTSIVLA